MKLFFLIFSLCSFLFGNTAFAQNVLFGEKGLFYEINVILSILFYLNFLFIGIITFLAQRGKKLLTFLTLILENVFILLIGVNFGLEKLSILLFVANPFILFIVTIWIIRSKGKFL